MLGCNNFRGFLGLFCQGIYSEKWSNFSYDDSDGVRNSRNVQDDKTLRGWCCVGESTESLFALRFRSAERQVD